MARQTRAIALGDGGDDQLFLWLLGKRKHRLSPCRLLLTSALVAASPFQTTDYRDASHECSKITKYCTLA